MVSDKTCVLEKAMMIEFETGGVRLAFQLSQMRFQIRDPFFGIEVHRNGQVGLRTWLAHQGLHPHR